jgi:hypothetical protein
MSNGSRRGYGRSAYGKLVLAQLILFFIGVLSIFVSAFAIRDAHEEVPSIFDEVPAQVVPGTAAADNEAYEHVKQELTRRIRIAHGIDVGVGVIFVLCALLVHRMPLTATVTGLALYVGMVAVIAIMEPALILQGYLLRILIIVGLSVATRAAFRSRRRRSERRQPA